MPGHLDLHGKETLWRTSDQVPITTRGIIDDVVRHRLIGEIVHHTETRDGLLQIGIEEEKTPRNIIVVTTVDARALHRQRRCIAVKEAVKERMPAPGVI